MHVDTPELVRIASPQVVGIIRTDGRPRRAAQLRSIALVALLAIASTALLPLVHASFDHAGDCGVCSVFAHDASSVADVGPNPGLAPTSVGPEVDACEPEAALPRLSVDRHGARAPPAIFVAV